MVSAVALPRYFAIAAASCSFSQMLWSSCVFNIVGFYQGFRIFYAIFWKNFYSAGGRAENCESSVSRAAR